MCRLIAKRVCANTLGPQTKCSCHVGFVYRSVFGSLNRWPLRLYRALRSEESNDIQARRRIDLRRCSVIPVESPTPRRAGRDSALLGAARRGAARPGLAGRVPNTFGVRRPARRFIALNFGLESRYSSIFDNKRLNVFLFFQFTFEP